MQADDHSGVRPTRRCLDSLEIEIPKLDAPLHLLAHELVEEAQSLPARMLAGRATRIGVLKDRVWFKVKRGRWRGVATRLTDADLHENARLDDAAGWTRSVNESSRWWLGAAGWREDGARRDFYTRIESECRCVWSEAKKDRINTDTLLPQEWDRRRIIAERAVAEQRAYRTVMMQCAARSLRSGKIVMAHFDAFAMGVLIRADRGEQFVAFIARQVYDPKRLAVMMSALPGVSGDDWGPEPAGIADLAPGPGEVVWSAVLTPEAANAILDAVPWSDEPV
ncbi:hypothetical protein [Dermacoccus abyssi]|uniref:hypothetical protein n=1 Tax=Dermacoccus abyssi TaxID=322596 RepID=UPI002AD30841|nr:hypothetical protein [Dermacoccus abyssi]